MKKVSLHELLIETANKSLEIINEKKGFYPSGKNGPHQHKETSVRNTAHWLITLLKVFKITKEEKFLKAAKLAINYLLSDEVRPYGFTFINRKVDGLDSCNGLIGQAWAIEALAEASKILGCEDCKEKAEEVFLLHPFDWDLGLWKARDIDGNIMKGFDLTLNHQIWFAAAGSIIKDSNSSKVSRQINRFLDCLRANISLSSEGRFLMPVDGKPHLLKGALYTAIKTSKLYNWLRLTRRGDNKKEMEKGYHCCHLYGLAMLKDNFPGHELWSSKIIKKSINYLFFEDFKQSVMKNKYGINYNPPGFETAYTLYMFKDIIDMSNDALLKSMSDWVSKQIIKTYNFEDKMMNQVKFDPETYAARVYEATRLPDINVTI
ncbi:MAG: hypothetical protein ACOCRK_04615 [bacterium]